MKGGREEVGMRRDERQRDGGETDGWMDGGREGGWEGGREVGREEGGQQGQLPLTLLFITNEHF